MAIHVEPYLRKHEPLVQAFNERLAGSGWAFYDKAEPNWLPPGTAPSVVRNYYLGVDDDGVVRGGYCLKTDEFLLRGETFVISSIQGPVSEGLVDPTYRMLAFQLIRDMEDRSPNLFAWGASDRAHELMLRLGFNEHRMPFQLRLARATRFLRRNGYLRRSPRNRLVLDILALTGAGAVAAFVAQGALRLGAGLPRPGRVEVVEAERFGPWADEIWETARGGYEMIAPRDSATMNVLLPETGWPEAHILQVMAKGRTIGWAAVRDTQFQGEGRFGDLRIGTIVDALARPGEESAVIAAASRYLERRGVDAMVSNFAHPAWRRAFRASGYLERAKQRPLLFNGAASDRIGDWRILFEGLHLTPLDGDGPHGL
jgi:hypothetical protein